MKTWELWVVGQKAGELPTGGAYVAPDLSGIAGATGNYAVQATAGSEYVVVVEVEV